MPIADEIAKLKALLDSGALSAEEFARAKARLLDAAATPTMERAGSWLHRLRRSRTDHIFGGVCGGLGQHSDMPAWAWRLLFLLTAIGFGAGLLFYVLLWLLVPPEDLPAA